MGYSEPPHKSVYLKISVSNSESRWDKPKEGFLSIKAQEDINRKHEYIEQKRIDTIYQSQAIHGSHIEEAPKEDASASSAPYGKWQTVET